MVENSDDTFPGLDGGDPRLEQVIARFEEAWRGGQRPSIDDCLWEDGNGRGRALIELVHVELELRLKAGEEARVEEYLKRYPELAEDAETLLELIVAEYEVRVRCDTSTSAADYLERFPQFGDELPKRLTAKPPHRPPQFPIRLNCPHCRNPIAIVDEEAPGEAVCPSCGSSFRLEQDQTVSWRPEKLPQLGKFKLLEEVGRGAFGTVYRARDTELDRIVAVKVPRSGTFSTEEDESRFVREARTAAQLSHSGIVPVYEVGRGEPQPYIVTQFVRGVTLADALTGRRYSFRESAEIVGKVAEALDHSHQQGVVHRDLKPSNIMLQDADHLYPLLMDFGLARRDQGEITVTLDGQVLGTPAYMSPEQARGESHLVDGRTDVYSLGVILYELLAGELPFRGNSRMLLFQVLNTDAQSPRKLNDSIPLDVETICLKCLEKEPRKRYATAAELADDLNRFLRDEPIHARPVSRLAKAWRWGKRNPRVASLSAAIVLLLTVVAVGSTVFAFLIAAERERAREEAMVAKATAGFLEQTFRTADPLAFGDLGFRESDREDAGKLTSREILNRGVRQVTEELSDQPLVQARMMDTLGGACVNCGLYEEAEALLEEALRIWQRENGPRDLSTAGSLYNLGWLSQLKGDYPKAEELYREALAIRESKLEPDHLDVAAVKFKLGLLFLESWRPREAESLFREVLAVRGKALGRTDPEVRIVLVALLALSDDPTTILLRLSELATSLDANDGSRLAAAAVTYARAKVASDKGRYVEAEPLYQRTLSLLREIFGDNAKNNLIFVLALGDTAVMYNKMGDAQKAEAMIREAFASGGRLVDSHPKAALAQRAFGDMLQDRGDFREAQEYLEQSLTGTRRSFGDTHHEVGYVLHSLGTVHRRKGEYVEAEACYRKARALLGEESWPLLVDFATSLHHRGALDEAVPLFRQGLEIMRRSPGLHLAIELRRASNVLRDAGIHEEASRLEREADEMIDASFSEGDLSLPGVLYLMAETLIVRGKPREAEKFLRDALELERKNPVAKHPSIAASMCRLADLLKTMGNFLEAEELYRSALAIREEKLGDQHPVTIDNQMKIALLLQAQGQGDDALKLGNKTLTAYRQRLGEDHPWVSRSLADLASIYRDTGDHHRAVELLREAYLLHRKALGDIHPEVTKSLLAWTDALCEKGDFAAAEAVLREGRKYLQDALPPNSLRMATVNGSLGQCLVSLGREKYEEAESLLLTSHEVLDTAFGADDSRTQQAIARLADLYQSWSKTDQSARYRSLLTEPKENRKK